MKFSVVDKSTPPINEPGLEGFVDKLVYTFSSESKSLKMLDELSSILGTFDDSISELKVNANIYKCRVVKNGLKYLEKLHSVCGDVIAALDRYEKANSSWETSMQIDIDDEDDVSKLSEDDLKQVKNVYVALIDSIRKTNAKLPKDIIDFLDGETKQDGSKLTLGELGYKLADLKDIVSKFKADIKKHREFYNKFYHIYTETDPGCGDRDPQVQEFVDKTANCMDIFQAIDYFLFCLARTVKK